MRGEKRRELGRPAGFLVWSQTGRQGRRIVSHSRGHPETAGGRSLRRAGGRSRAGKPSPRRCTADPAGVRSAHRTQRRASRAAGEGADSRTERAQETLTGQGGSDTSRQTSRRGIAPKAASHKKHRVGNLSERLNEALLHEGWRDLHNNAAYGVDGVSAEDYAQHLEENRRDLVGRLQRPTYGAKLVRRHYLPTGDGRLRPVGIPAIEDTLVPLAVARRLEAIDAQEFRRCRYGDRPQVGPLAAVRTLTIKRQCGRSAVVVEAAITGCFDPSDPAWRLRMLEERIADRAQLRLIQNWLQAGGLDTDGQVLPPAPGTPQGGGGSPIWAHVYLHDALDRWVEKVVKKRWRGEACLIRYAEACVGALEDHEDAPALYTARGERLGTFTLELAAEQTRSIAGPRQQSQTSVEFRGVELRWGKERSGKAHLKRRTSRKKLQKSLANFTAWCRKSRNLRLRRLFERLNAKRQGYYNSYGVKGHVSSLAELYNRARSLLVKWLNRRSPRRSRHGPGFNAVLAHFHVPRPRITERPRSREAASQASAVCGRESC
jgi:RNA-directed DNA polymerase